MPPLPVPAGARLAARSLVVVGLVAVAGWAPAQPPARPGPVVGPMAAQPPRGEGGEQQQPPPPQVQAQGKALTQAVIDEAVDRGVSYLRQTQNFGNGTWGKGTNVGPGGGWVVGYTALCGIALIEAGIPPSDPSLQKAAQVVRLAYPKIEHTYEASLAILLLDRMGEKKDKPMIQGLALRLIAGQTGTGGWAYKVPLVDQASASQILGSLKQLNPPVVSVTPSFRDRPAGLALCIKASDDVRPRPPVKGAGEPAADPGKVIGKLPQGLRGLPVFVDHSRLPSADPEKKGDAAVNGTSDNSNTHFATIGLWASRRHEVPTDRTFALLNRRFRTSQSGDGSWGYLYSAEGKSSGSSALTCVALLGLAIGHALDLDKNDNARPEQDPKILKAFKMLGTRVGAPTGFVGNRPTPKEAGGLYYLWALERIAVLYDVNTLDGKDWYKWGAEILCTHQQADGSWLDGGYHGEHPALNTALAVLFLKRANLTPDLSRRLIVDPNALTARVTPSTPPPSPPPPLPPEPPTPPPEPMPDPEPKVETPPAPRTPEPAPAETPYSSPAPKASSNLGLYLGIGAGVLVLLGLLALLLLRSRPEEKPAKKGKKGKAAARRRDDEDDDDDDEEEEERPRKKRRK